MTTNPHLVTGLRMRATVSRLTHMPSLSGAELNTEATLSLFCGFVKLHPRKLFDGASDRRRSLRVTKESAEITRTQHPCGPGSVVGIETGYGLDGPGIESRWERDFPHLTRRVLGPTHPPVQWVPDLSRGKERPGSGTDPSPSSSAVVKKE